MSYKRQELLTLREHLSSVLFISLVFCVVLLCVFTFWGPCCVVRFEFRIKTMFGSSLSPTVCGRQTIGDKDEPNIVLMFMSYLHCLCRPVCPMLPVTPWLSIFDCPSCIAPPVFPNVNKHKYVSSSVFLLFFNFLVFQTFLNMVVY